MKQIRCKSCGKLLAKAIYTELEIKCPRCKTLNHMSVKNALSEDHESPIIGEETRGKNISPSPVTIHRAKAILSQGVSPTSH